MRTCIGNQTFHKVTMEVKSKLIILCVVMSIILQMASTYNGNIKKPSRKKRFAFSSIISGIGGAINTVVPVVRNLLRFGRRETQNAVQEMKKMMKAEETEMTKEVHGRAEMLMALLEAKLAMDASSATACSCSWLMVSCACVVVVNLLRL
ncbi:uncharacterized protein LOC124125572 [Haliotis rufescens]|uniref:uncharacterized protein LOC124125572 n=1 Tax=Haliotis rufescens TaxID=6454 RepID=UPI00201F734C|nr:uncharacterized protein LOC124125572 [Haliotis rufescens]